METDVISHSSATVLRVVSDRIIQIKAVRSFGKPGFGSARFGYAISQDAGRSWKWIDRVLPSSAVLKYGGLFESPSNSLFLYRKEEFAYYRSADGGTTWQGLKLRLQKDRTDAVSTTSTHPAKVDLSLAAIYPREPNIIYGTFRTVTNLDQDIIEGMYISHDAGDSWQEFSRALVNGSVLGISPSQPDIMLGQGHEGLVISDDGGGHWKEVLSFRRTKPNAFAKVNRGEFAPQVEIYQVAFDPHDSGRIFVVANIGLLRSADRGGSWCLLRVGADAIDRVSSVALSNSGATLAVGTTDGVFWSENYGDSFKNVYSTADNSHK